MGVEVKLRPMRPVETGLVLATVTLAGLACFYGLRPTLERAGWASYPAYLASLSAVFILMLAWTAIAYSAEGLPWTREAFLQRTRLGPVRVQVLLWGVGLGAFMFLLTALYSPALAKGISTGLLPLPAEIPDYLNPSKQQSLALLRQQFAAQGVLPFIPLVLIVNITAEELFWRGMIFPRQELEHGRRAWLVHGFIWAFSHLFQYWMLPPILVGSLALAWIVQRTRSTWVGVVGHLVNNGLPFLLMLFLAP